MVFLPLAPMGVLRGLGVRGEAWEGIWCGPVAASFNKEDIWPFLMVTMYGQTIVTCDPAYNAT